MQVYFADIAGLNDTGGDTIEYVNSFITKEIFRHANTVKFLVPITLNQIMEDRGHSVRQLVETIRFVCQSNNEDLLESIQPILTKCNPKNQDFDIDNIRALLWQQFQTILQTVQIESNIQ